jgi:hypothetical protein
VRLVEVLVHKYRVLHSLGQSIRFPVDAVVEQGMASCTLADVRVW